jgi:cyclopropane fatty-acyl-phospholipid synthase-like methyltransferase
VKQEANREELIIHIKGLQQTLTERNAHIAELEKQLTKAGMIARAEREVKKAYKQGWQACASRLMEITRKTALELSEVRKEAWQAYLEGENK